MRASPALAAGRRSFWSTTAGPFMRRAGLDIAGIKKTGFHASPGGGEAELLLG